MEKDWSKEQLYILGVLRKSLGTGPCFTENEIESKENLEAIEFSNELDPAEVCKIIMRNGILLTVYQELDTKIKSLADEQYLKQIKQAILQQHEGTRCIEALNKEGLMCLPLKGWELRKMYPREDMRQMVDVDILVKPFDFQKISKAMKELGYKFKKESFWKHVSFTKENVNIELHKRLFDDAKEIKEWESNILEELSCTGQTYAMRPEDFYVHHFVHLYNDFKTGFLGLRRIVDSYLLQEIEIKKEEVKKTLDSLGVLEFHDRIVKTSKVMMGQEEVDENSRVLLQHAFTYGIYGAGKSYKAGRIVRMGNSLEGGKKKSILSAVFLPYELMKGFFPVLEDHPFLLPICWIRRIISFLGGDINRYKKMMNYSDVSEEDCEEMRQYFRAGGLEF